MSGFRDAVTALSAAILCWVCALVPGTLVGDAEMRVVDCDLLQSDLAAACATARTFVHAFVDERNYANMGFRRMPAVEELVFGVPLKVRTVALEALVHGDSVAPDSVVRATGEVWLFVEQGGRAVSRMGLRLGGVDGWEVVSAGSDSLTQRIAHLRRVHAASSALAPEDYSVVRVPGTAITFLAHPDAEGVLQFINVYDHEDYGLIAGESGPAELFLTSLRVLAKDPRVSWIHGNDPSMGGY